VSELEPRNDDEALSALLDGTLSSETAAALTARLEREPELAARFEAMERANRAVQAAYRDVVDEPLPERVLDLLRAPRAGDDRVVELRPRARRSSPAWFPHALAAGIALAVGVGLGFGLSQRGGESGPAALLAAAGAVAPGSPLHDLLESAPSGVPRALDGGARAEARFTFRAEDGDWCRELAVTTDAASSAALACRRSGAWRVELLGIEAAGGELYRPAGADSPFQEAVDGLMDGEPLEPDAERALLASAWASD
jgi:hypothetical protein